MTSPEEIKRGIEAAEAGDYLSAIKFLRPLAETGNPEAQFQLGMLALTECDLITGKEAYFWFESSANQGHALAMFQLATFPYFRTFDSPLSDEESWDLLLRAAEHGCVDAQYHLGALFATGDNFKNEVDQKAAFVWYQKAAEADHPEAQFNLAFMYLLGEGCVLDRELAIMWLEKAVAKNHEQAKTLLNDIRSGLWEKG
jgi:uncharacterized protein